jgi:hypothetical protein
MRIQITIKMISEKNSRFSYHESPCDKKQLNLNMMIYCLSMFFCQKLATLVDVSLTIHRPFWINQIYRASISIAGAYFQAIRTFSCIPAFVILFNACTMAKASATSHHNLAASANLWTAVSHCTSPLPLLSNVCKLLSTPNAHYSWSGAD